LWEYFCGRTSPGIFVEEEYPGPQGQDGDPHKAAPGAAYEERLAHFIQLLSDDDETSRWKAAEALGRIADPAATAALIDTLWDDDARVRLKAAWALGRIGDMQAYAPLQRLYRIEDEGAQEIIREALENIRRESSS
jgi:HEAT repeat protein